jgi:hypothetical protein
MHRTGICSSSERQHVWFMHDRTPPHFLRCHTTCDPHFRWTVDRTRRSNQLACTISWPQSSGFFAVGTPECFGVLSADQQLRNIRSPVENICQEIQFKTGIFDRMFTSVPWGAESCVETHGSHIYTTCCRDQRNISCISVGIGFLTNIDWEFLLI